MWKKRLSAIVAVSLVALGTTAGAVASSHHRNKGDAWLDNAGQPPGPGHEMDPHLTCDDLNLWGDKMADPSGPFTIIGLPPTGNREVVYSNQWNYDRGQGGDQIMQSIDVAPLIQAAERNGDRAINKQGFHFKLQLVQQPQKHKSFWIRCPNGSF